MIVKLEGYSQHPIPTSSQLYLGTLDRQPLAFSFHFSTLIPFTRSQRQSDASPIKAGTRMAGDNRFATAGGRNNAKLVVQKDTPAICLKAPISFWRKPRLENQEPP